MHLCFAVSLYRLQLREVGFFLHKHPSGAGSLRETVTAPVLNNSSVGTITSDQCEYDLFLLDNNGQPQRVRKRTRWASNSPQMLSRLSRRCSGTHTHMHLEGGLPAYAAGYPPTLILEILRGMRDTLDQQNPAEEDIVSLVQPTLGNSGFVTPSPPPSHAQQFRDLDVAAAVSKKTSVFKFADGTTKTIKDWAF